MLNNFIRQLSKDIGAESPLEPSSEGVYEYYIAEDLPIIITELHPEGFIFTSNLGPYPKGKEEEFFSSMMTGNLFGKETMNATLGIDAEGTNMTLSRVVDRRV